MLSNYENNSGQEPYWRAFASKIDMRPSDRLSDIATRFDFDTVKKFDADDDVAVRISSEDFEFIQKKMQDEFYVSPRDVIHNALWHLQKSDDEHRKKFKERNAKNPSDPSIA